MKLINLFLKKIDNKVFMILLFSLLLLVAYFNFNESIVNFFKYFIILIYTFTIIETIKLNKIFNIISISSVVFFVVFYLPAINYIYYGFNYRWNYSDVSNVSLPLNLVLQAHIIFLLSYKLIKSYSRKTIKIPKTLNINLISKNTYLFTSVFIVIFIYFISGTLYKSNISGFGAYLYLIQFLGIFLPYMLFLIDKIKLGFFIQLLVSIALIKAEANGAAIIGFMWYFVLLYFYKQQYRKYFFIALSVAFTTIYIVLTHKYDFENSSSSFMTILMNAFVINVGRLEQLHLTYDVFNNGELNYTYRYFLTQPFTFLINYFHRIDISYADEVTKVVYGTKDMWGSIGGCSVAQAYSDLGYFGIYIYFIFYGMLAGFLEKIKITDKLSLFFYIMGLIFITLSLQESMRVTVLYFMLIPLLLLNKINFSIFKYKRVKKYV